MLFSYNWLQSFFYSVKSSKAGISPKAKLFNRVNKKLPKPGKLAELLTMHSFEVEGLKRVGNDWVLDLDILSNRAHDCLSHIGVAREIGAVLGIKPCFPKVKLKEDKKDNIKNYLSLEIKDRKGCLRYTAKMIKNVKVGPSPKWLREKLEVCGLNSINNIVDITNYVMLETGQPLHAFDFDKLEGKKIIVRKAKKGEEITTLDDKTFDLDEDILIIADTKDPLAIAGIKGGKKAEIGKTTKTIILEAANFEMRTIRGARQKLGLCTEASLRFEHQPDPNLTLPAIDRAAGIIQKIAGGKIAGGVIDVYPKKVRAKRIKLSRDYVKKLLGVEVPQKEINRILKSLGFKLKTQSSKLLEIEIPTFRQDISIPEDLVEEIGRIYGYDKIPAIFPQAALIPPKRNESIFWEDMTKDILKEVGFTEIYNYSFVSEKDISIYQLNQRKSADIIEIENPVSIEQKYLRPSLIPNLVKNIKNNLVRNSDIRIFELGKTFKRIRNPARANKAEPLKIIEKKMLCAAVTTRERESGFYELKGVIDLLLNKLGISNIWYDHYQPTPEESEMSIWQPKICAEIKIDGEEIGFLGEISSKILEELKVSKKIVVFDINFEKLQKLCCEEHEYQLISRYPSAVRDIAVLVPYGVLTVNVLNKINAAGGALVRDVDLFDIYEGKELPGGKKNFGFHIIYQAEDRTLTNKEIDQIHQKIIRALEEDPEWEVRK